MAIENSTLFSWEGGSKEGWGKEGGYKRRVGGREGRRQPLMKGTSEEGTGRGMGSGREEASGGGIERGMEGEQGRVI